MNKLVVLIAFALAVPACAESNTHHDSGPSSPDAFTPTIDTGIDAPTPTVDSGPPAQGGLVVNEIEATGTEFVELLNTGAAPVDLSALRFTDDDMGMPNAGHATMIPAGVVLHTGDRFVILTNVNNPMTGLLTDADCTITGVTRCMQVSFGLSNTNGDGAYVLASDDSVVAMALYPAMGAPTDRSYCRLPDGTGAFAECAPTADAINAAP